MPIDIMGDGRNSRIKDRKDRVRYNGAPSQDLGSICRLGEHPGFRRLIADYRARLPRKSVLQKLTPAKLEQSEPPTRFDGGR